MLKTAPHSPLSPQMWCIKKKDWFARTQIYWREFENLSNAKIRSDLFSKNVFSTPYLL